MLKVLNCFQLIPDLDQVPDALWASGDPSGPFPFLGVKRILNPQDESALELSLRLPSDRRELHALTFGGSLADKTLRTLLALGYSQGTRIDWEPSNQLESFDVERVASLLASEIREDAPADVSYDVIALGVQNAETGTKKLPLLLSSKLGVPCITQVLSYEDASTEDQKMLRVTWQEDGCTITETLPCPLVLAVGDAPGVFLRVPTLLQRRDCKANPTVVAPSDQLPDSGIQLLSVTMVDSSREHQILQGKDLDETVSLLYENYLKEVIS